MAKHSTLNRESTVRLCDGPPGCSEVAKLVRRLTVNQEMRRFDSCPRSHFASPPGGRSLKPPYKRSQRTAAWSLDRHQGRGPGRGCRLVTALLLQRRSVEFDPLPRHQFGTYAEAERHLTFNQDEVGSIPTGSTKVARVRWRRSDGDHRQHCGMGSACQ